MSDHNSPELSTEVEAARAQCREAVAGTARISRRVAAIEAELAAIESELGAVAARLACSCSTRARAVHPDIQEMIAEHERGLRAIASAQKMMATCDRCACAGRSPNTNRDKETERAAINARLALDAPPPAYW